MRQPKSQVDVVALQEDLADILSSAGELANARAAKVITARTEQHTALDLQSFWTLFNVSWDFVVKSEVICRRMIVGLRGVVVSQVSNHAPVYVAYRHDAVIRPKRFYKPSTNNGFLNQLSWSKMNSGARRRCLPLFSISSTLSWMRRYMTRSS